MSKKLSFDDKKYRMLQLLQERGEFFQLKDLEKLAPKEKGIQANSVKDVVQSLVDEGVIETDKIGGSIYFWSFPSTELRAKKRKLDEVKSELDASTKELQDKSEKLMKFEENKENMNLIKKLTNECAQLKVRKLDLQNKLEKSDKKGLNVEQLEKVKKAIPEVKDAANRWTDNIFQIKSWCKKKFMMEESVLNKQFGIKDDLDYID